MQRADFHSRLVGWLKLALPLAALAILSTLFLIADRIDPDAAIPYAEVDVEDLVNDPRMSAPAYAGTTSDGAGISVSAAAARPSTNGSGASADGVVALIETPDGGRIDITASRADMDDAEQTVTLQEGVTVTTSTGFRILTDRLTARLDRTGMESTSAIEITAPLGRITAKGFELTQDPSEADAYLLVFNGGVKLIYEPGG